MGKFFTKTAQAIIPVNKNIYLQEGIDAQFFNDLKKHNEPFLNAAHLKDPHQYTIVDKDNPIGFIQIGKKPANFGQVAIIPEQQGKQITEKVINAVGKELNLDKIGWTAYKDNYPSLKLLYNMGGGVFDSSLDPNKKKIEGVLKFKHNISNNSRENLKSLLEESKDNYAKRS